MRDPQTTRPDRLHSERANRGRERVTAPHLAAHFRPHILKHALDCADRALRRAQPLHEFLPGLVNPLLCRSQISHSLIEVLTNLVSGLVDLVLQLLDLGLNPSRHTIPPKL